MHRLLCLCALLIPCLAVAETGIDDRCRAPAEKWRPIFEQEKLNHLVAAPFVIAGDGSAERLAGYRDRTILAARRALQRQYFDRPLEEPVLILLFESAGPYRGFARRQLGNEDVPHYGFFRQRDNLMLMNVGTGTGTLVHELTHALIRPDFPQVPSWFNEGLASLFEQCTIREDSIAGLPNWRLPGLQKAIRDAKLRPLAEMMADGNFYDEAHVGANYAQARYLMLYLQEKKLLRTYYRAFRDDFAADPTGVAALKKTLGTDDLNAFDQTWREWVLTLRFPAE